MAPRPLPALASQAAPDKRKIFALERAGAAMVGEQRGEALMRGVGLGDDQQPGRVLVESMDDAWPLDAADARQVSPQWRISALTSVPAAWPGAGCTTSPAGLSTMSKCSSSKTTVSGRSSPAIADSSAGGASSAMLALGDPHRRIARLAAVDRHLTGLDQRLQSGARQGEVSCGGRLSEETVQPLAGVLYADVEKCRPSGAASGARGVA